MTQKNFSRLVETYEKLIYSICYQFTQNHHTAQDLAQETFISAYHHIDSCPKENYKPWFARIATNKAKDYLKSAYHQKVTATEETQLPEMVSEQDNPEEILITQACSDSVKRLIYDLKEPYHKAAVLYFIEEQSIDEISNQLNRPSKTVYTQLSRAKAMLQSQLIGEENSNGSVFN